MSIHTLSVVYLSNMIILFGLRGSNRWIALAEARINLPFLLLRAVVPLGPDYESKREFPRRPDNDLLLATIYARGHATRILRVEFITHVGACAYVFFNSNNGPVIFYAEAIFITYVCLSPCLKGKYKLVVMPQCSSKSFLHQGTIGVRAYLLEIRADHTRYSSITFNRKRYIMCCFTPCLKGIKKMFLIAVVSHRTGFATSFSFPEILYTPLVYLLFYLLDSSCTSSEILRSSRCKIVQECLITEDIYHADKRRILPA